MRGARGPPLAAARGWGRVPGAGLVPLLSGSRGTSVPGWVPDADGVAELGLVGEGQRAGQRVHQEIRNKEMSRATVRACDPGCLGG